MRILQLLFLLREIELFEVCSYLFEFVFTMSRVDVAEVRVEIKLSIHSEHNCDMEKLAPFALLASLLDYGTNVFDLISLSKLFAEVVPDATVGRLERLLLSHVDVNDAEEVKGVLLIVLHK